MIALCDIGNDSSILSIGTIQVIINKLIHTDMKTETLANIRKGMRELLPVVKSLKIMNAEHFPVVGVLFIMIQNLSGDFTECENYVEAEELALLQQSNLTFAAIGHYEKDYYVARYICEQANMIIEGNVMAEEFDEIYATAQEEEGNSKEL